MEANIVSGKKDTDCHLMHVLRALWQPAFGAGHGLRLQSWLNGSGATPMLVGIRNQYTISKKKKAIRLK
jgi:hypothetical protein